MGNTEPNSKNQDHAFEIGLTSANNNDWTLIRQALEFSHSDAPTGKEPDSPQK